MQGARFASTTASRLRPLLLGPRPTSREWLCTTRAHASPKHRAAALALVTLLAGCLEAATGPGDDDEAWIFGGAWTEGFSEADTDAWCDVATQYGNECAVMESDPPQYALRFANEATCREAREKVLALDHVTARECTRVVLSDDPDAPTRSPPAERWSLHGTFAPGYSAQDMEDVCQAGAGSPDCAMTRSEPPQYSFTFSTREACEDARAGIAAVASARPGECVPSA